MSTQTRSLGQARSLGQIRHLGRLRRTALVLPALVAALALGACGGSGDDSSGTDSGGADSIVASEAEVQRDAPIAGEEAFDGSEQRTDAGAASVETGYPQRSVISTGVVSLRSTDVAELRFDVRSIVDLHRGEITEEATETNDEGEVKRSRLVIRVPVTEFADTMAELEDAGELVASSSTSEDVTTQVIDTQVRIRAQEKSLERVEILLARAQSIRDIIAIEAQLTRRQADLDSLKQQMAWLEDQTSMSTITVQLSTTPKDKPADEDESGFLAGLQAGWDGLTSFAVGAATVLGALLPFAVVLAVVGLPVWLLVRRSLHRRRPVPDAAPPSAGTADA